MNSKKLCLFLAVALVMVSSCFAYADDIKLGLLARTRESVETISAI